MASACTVDPDGTKPYAEAVDRYGIGASDAAKASASFDPLFVWNAVASDVVAFSCGRIASPGKLSLTAEEIAKSHKHEDGEVARCLRMAQLAEACFEGQTTNHGDEGDHYWHAFSAPASSNEPTVRSLNSATLHQATGHALYSQFEYSFKTIEEDIEAMARDGDEDFEASPLLGARQFVELVKSWGSEVQESKFITVRDNSDFENGAPVVPIFYVALLTSGSIVGVSGLVVWT